jgi:hypothetical protein
LTWLRTRSSSAIGPNLIHQKRGNDSDILGLGTAPANLHRCVARGLKLEHVLCYQEERVVQNDWTVSWCNRVLQLAERHQKLALARKKILVSELLDGTLRLTYHGRELQWRELPERPERSRPRGTPGVTSKPHSKPAIDHPWRRRPAVG